MERFANLTDKKHAKEKQIEMRDSMNNAIRMVIINSMLNILFKLPQMLVPIENAVETFYFHSKRFDHCDPIKTCHFGIASFSNNFRDSFVYYMLPDLSDSLYNILISIQLFLYAKFDKKIKMGLDRLAVDTQK